MRGTRGPLGCALGSLPVLLVAFLSAQSGTVETGLAQFQRGEYEEAKKSLALSSDPRARVYHQLARAATGECDAASPELQREFDSQTDVNLRLAAGLGLAQCAVSKERFDVAFTTLEKLRQTHPDNADVLYLAAKLHMKAWNDSVYRLYQKAPASYRVHQISGEVFEMQGRLTEAAGEFRKAIAKNPAALNLHYRLGRALLLESRTPESLAAALGEFEAELKLNPGDAAAHYQVAQILTAQAKPEEAAARYEKALERDPKFTEAMIALARIHLDGKRNAEAISLLERAIALAPKSEAARYNLMLAYRNAGRREDAQRQKQELDRLQQPPAGEFTEFLKKLGEQPAKK